MSNELPPDATSEDLAELLMLGERGEGPSSRATEEQALHEMLSIQLSLDGSTPDSPPTVIGRPCEELRPRVGWRVDEVVLDPEAGVTVVKTLKDYARALARRGESPAIETAAKAVYYGAIANALVFHGHKITQHSHERLERAFEMLQAEPWIAPELKQLFEDARQACQVAIAKTRTGGN